MEGELIMRHILFGLTLLSLFLFVQCSDDKVEVSDAQLVNMRTTSVDFMKELKGYFDYQQK